MDKEQQLLNLIGLARRAGKLISGEELVIKAVQNGKAKLVFVAKDSSQNLIKKINDKANYYEVEVSQIFSEDEISQSIGQHRKVIAILDAGFSKKMESLMD